jgi:hypothetical protein
VTHFDWRTKKGSQSQIHNSDWWIMKSVVFLLGGVCLWILLAYATYTYSESLRGLNFWGSWTYEPQHGICERERTLDFIREPANAWSDFSYVAVGIYILLQGVYDLYYGEVSSKKSLIIQYPSISIVYGIYNIIHGFGSFWFHACRCAEGGQWDQAPMQTVVSFPIFYTIYQHFSRFNEEGMREQSTHGTFLFVYSICGACFVIFKRSIKNEIAMIVLITLIFVSLGYNYWNRRNTHVFYGWYFWGCLGFFGIGFLTWWMDQQPMFCNPDSWLQYHAFWHLLTAIALIGLYLYLRTEEARSDHVEIVEID